MNEDKNENNVKSYFSGILTTLLIGLSAGFVLGILFAPKSGKETRKEIKDKSEELVKKSKDSLDEIAGKTKDYVDKSKSKLAELKSRGEDFVGKSKKTISGISKVIGSEAKETGKKIRKVVKKGKNTAKKVEEELS
jgi:gas vesicle protein